MSSAVPALSERFQRLRPGPAEGRWSGLPWFAVLALSVAVVGLIGNVFALGNPGLFNHDEIQAYEDVDQRGVLGYAWEYATALRTADLGSPVRPLGRAIWGVEVAPLPDAPVLSHALDVLTHLLNAALIGILVPSILRAEPDRLARRAGLVAAVLFAVSPLTSLASAWSAASFDRSYTSFSLLAVIAAVSWISRAERGIARWPQLWVVVLCALAAGLSKETAVMLPLAMAGWILLMHAVGWRGITWRIAAQPIVAAGVGLVPYLMLRVPGILGSAAGQQTTDAYDLQTGLVLKKAVFFFAFPFSPRVVELQNLAFSSRPHLALLAALHVLFLVVILVALGWKFLAAYVTLYFAFLVPILFIPNTNSHYLYGSAGVVAVALAMLTCGRWRVPLSPVLAATIALFTFHHVYAQRAVYDMGRCHVTFFDTLAGRLAEVGVDVRTQPIAVVPDAGSPGYVAARMTLGTTRIAEFSGLRLVYAADQSSVPADAQLVLRFDSGCRALPMPPVASRKPS